MSLSNDRAAVISETQSAMVRASRSSRTVSADDIRALVTIPAGAIATSQPAEHAHLMRAFSLANSKLGGN